MNGQHHFARGYAAFVSGLRYLLASTLLLHSFQHVYGWVVVHQILKQHEPV